MSSTPTHKTMSAQRGFSLVLSLVIMTMMLMMVVVLASFLKVEASLAVAKQAEVSARINALSSMRLARAALQQRLGPDTRVSASATIYADPAINSLTSPGADPFQYQVLGVWRSWEGNDHDIRMNSRYAGRPQKPDYLSKLKPYVGTNPAAGRFLGWMISSQWGYGTANPPIGTPTATKPPAPPLVIPSTQTVPLLGAATDTVATRQINTAPISFVDGLPAATTTDASQGFFAWWVCGENQKVRLNIPYAATPSTGTNLDWSQRNRSFGQPDLEAIGYPSLLLSAYQMPVDQPLTVPSLFFVPPAANPSRLTTSLANALPAPLAKAGFFDVSLFSEGLLTNTATGGLRKDLSLFTETWDLGVSLDPSGLAQLPLFRLKPATVTRTSLIPAYDLTYQRPLPDGAMPSGIGNRRRHALMYWWSDYGSLGGTSAGVASDGGTNFGGYAMLSSFPPIRSWAYLTDYALHYRKYVVNPDPTLTNIISMDPPRPTASTNGGTLYCYYERIHRHPLIARIQYVFATTANGTTPGFIVQPVVTLWNPFNVQLTVPSFNAYVKWQSLPIYIRCNEKGGAFSITQPVANYFTSGVTLQIGGGAAIALAPGQTRVFAMNNTSPITIPQGSGNTAYPLTPGYVASGRSGWAMMLPVTGAPTVNSILQYSIVKDISNASMARDGIYYDYYPANYAYSPVRFSFVGLSTAQFDQLYGNDFPSPFDQLMSDAAVNSRAFGTFSFGLRLSNDGVSQYTTRSGIKTVSKGFLMSSPFTTYTEIGQKSAEVLTAYPYSSSNYADPTTMGMSGQIGATNPGAFYSSSNTGVQYSGALNPVNAPYDLYYLPMTGFGDLNGPQSDVGTGYSGFILTGLDPTTGLENATVAELPVKPIQSIFDLQGCDIRATNPAPPFQYGLIGNGDASPILPPDDAVGRWIDQTGALRSRDELHMAFLQHDDSYCLNHILFDDWFCSSLAPQVADWANLRPAAGAEFVWNPAVMTSMQKSWSNFVAGTPLPNTYYQPAATAATFDITVAGQGPYTNGPPQPQGYLRIAQALRVIGQFNVNSTSVPAWRALLGNLRTTQVPYLKPGNSSVTNVASSNPLSRMAVGGEGPVTTNGTSGAACGFAAMTDAQLDQMATYIVQQIKLRGPFLSLSEFINRQLAAPQPNNPLDPCLSGVVGTAIKALENMGASMSLTTQAAGIGKTTSKVGDFGGLEQFLPLGDWANSPLGSKGDFTNPQAAVGYSTFGFPGWPRQADVMSRLAPVISVRDETFTVRAMGTATVTGGGSAKVWCEAVFQRIPDYVDATVPAYEAPLGDIAPAANGTLHQVNVTLGRRFKMIYFRWLTPQEL